MTYDYNVIKIYFNTKSTAPKLIDAHKPGSLVLIENPSPAEVAELTTVHKLDADLVLDGLDPNEAPRTETYEKKVYIFTRFALPETEKQTTSPLLIVYGLDSVYVITRTHFSGLDRLLKSGYIITSKRTQTLLQLLAEINIGYKVRINTVAKKIWRIRSQLDKAQIDNKDFISFIDIEEDMNDFLLALEPMNTQLNHLMSGKSVRLFSDDQDIMEDLELSSEELIRLADGQLKTIRNVREAYSTITANNLNRVFKLMTSITILMGIFTLITGIYSMNIALPAGHNPNAFWIILGVTGSLIGIVTYFFKKNRWF